MEKEEDDFFDEESTKSDYEKISKLGSGAYGSVYKAIMKKKSKNSSNKTHKNIIRHRRYPL